MPAWPRATWLATSAATFGWLVWHRRLVKDYEANVDVSKAFIQLAMIRIMLITYIFSNTNELAVSYIRRAFPFFANFNGYILSYEHGAMKPDAKLYEVVEQQSGHSQSEILYLDDRPENIAAGAARGWRVILQESPEQTRAVVESLGLLNHS